MHASFTYRRPIFNRPKFLGDGQKAALINPRHASRRHELALIIEFIVRRRLFGFSYMFLQPDYFNEMPPASGVFLLPVVSTALLFPGINKPGDIDLLIVPYEKDELVLDRVMAIEFKIIRASFNRQGKSPNEFGFTQALHLQRLGFPFVCVGHIIISDQSPSEHWMDVMCGELADDDKLINLRTVRADPMPSDLIERAFGRLEANSPSKSLGLLAAYMKFSGDREQYFSDQSSVRIPSARPATLNPAYKISALDAVDAFFHKYFRHFFDTPRHDPVGSS